MSSERIDTSADPEPAQEPKAKRKPGQESQASEKGRRGQEDGSQDQGGSPNKKAKVVALMKRAKGATLAEIIEATGWQAHTVRGFVSILGKTGGEKIESFKSADGERLMGTAGVKPTRQRVATGMLLYSPGIILVGLIRSRAAGSRCGTRNTHGSLSGHFAQSLPPLHGRGGRW
jgi:uncharacterized protein DUF3489